MSDVQNPYLEFLRQVLTHWPKYDLEASGSNLDKYMARIADFISNDFDSDDLLSGIKGFGNVEELTQLNDNFVIIKFFDTGSTLYKAEIRKGPDEKIILESVKYECPACFGSGKLEERDNKEIECYICGGIGWGVK